MSKKENTCKRYVVRIYSPEAIAAVDGLPRGYRSAVVEAALVSYLKTEAGRELIESLRYRSGKMPGGPGSKAIPGVYDRLRGDF